MSSSPPMEGSSRSGQGQASDPIPLVDTSRPSFRSHLEPLNKIRS